jgi:hypothetical protein
MGLSDVWTWLGTPEAIERLDREEELLQQPGDFPQYQGPLAAISHLDSLLPDFDDFPTDVLDPDLATTPNQPETCGSSDTANTQEAVLKLTQLHLDLHQCLGKVRFIEARKKRALLSPDSGSSLPMAPDGFEQVFKTSESFLELLNRVSQGEGQILTPLSTQWPSHHESVLTPYDKGTSELSNPDLLDTATGLMIMSCYTRLLQIFEVLVSLLALPQSRESCAFSMVAIKIGDFSPAADKGLAVRLLSQYVSYLLDSLSKAVDRTESFLPGLGQAITEIRKAERRLREQLSEATWALIP